MVMCSSAHARAHMRAARRHSVPTVPTVSNLASAVETQGFFLAGLAGLNPWVLPAASTIHGQAERGGRQFVISKKWVLLLLLLLLTDRRTRGEWAWDTPQLRQR